MSTFYTATIFYITLRKKHINERSTRADHEKKCLTGTTHIYKIMKSLLISRLNRLHKISWNRKDEQFITIKMANASLAKRQEAKPKNGITRKKHKFPSAQYQGFFFLFKF